MDAEADQGTSEGTEQAAAPESGQTPAAGTDEGTGAAAAAESAPKKPKPRKQSSAKKTRTVELTLTVTGTAEGEWQAELLHSGKRVVQGLPIPAAAVSKAAAELHEDISEAIEGVISAAREQHEAKLAELEAEVERVRKALSDQEG